MPTFKEKSEVDNTRVKSRDYGDLGLKSRWNFRYNGTGWAAQNATAPLYGVAVLSATEAWAVGDNGTILHYDGMVWTNQVPELPTGLVLPMLKGVFAGAADDVWAVGAAGTILHYDGLSWMPQASGTTRFLHAVSGCDRRNVWAVGEGGTILHYDGTNWSAQVSGTAYALYGVSARAADDVWAVGGEGIILHWNGTGWHINRRGYLKQDWFWGVCAADTNHVWAVGEDVAVAGFIVRGKPGGPPAVIQEPVAVTFDPWTPPVGPLPARVDLRGEIPPVGNQTDISPGGQTCGPWAIAYCQLTQWVKHFRRPNWDLTRPEYRMSPAFIYRYGSDFQTFDALTNRGCVDLAEVPFDTSFTGPDPSPAQLEAAQAYRIRGYETLWLHPKPEQPPYPDNDLEKAKTRLANGYVLSAGVFTQAGDFPDNDQNPPAVFYDPPNNPGTANHWAAFVGYDDNFNPAATDPLHRGGFLLMNYWGDHWNGEMHGFLWVSYAWVKNYVDTAYALDGDGPNGPAIAGCDPILASVGDTVTLTGTGFGGLRRQAGVTFNGLAAPVVSFANESIAVTVPPGATTGPLIVFDWEGTPSNATNFIIKPTLLATPR
jgi:hypothetical protein